MNARAVTVKALMQVLAQGKSLDEALDIENTEDLSLIKFMSYGILREYQHLEFILNALLNKPLKAKELELKLILMLGLFQLKSSRIPTHAAINETVELSKKLKYEYASGLVNAILRRYIKEQDHLLAQLQQANILEHPEWFIKKIKASYPTHWQAIITANNEHPPMHLRVNKRKISRDAYLKILEEHHIKASAPIGFDDAISLTTPIDVAELPYFQEGYVSVQDLAAQLAAPLLDLQPGQDILDACAAPGGKSCHILEHADVNLTSMDVSAKRLLMIKDNLQRLGLKATTLEDDASNPLHLSQQFDRILIDAPCSGTGVIRRHPDIKFLRKESDIIKFHHLQVEIITRLSAYLKPNGFILYATCSILPEENDMSIKTALDLLPDFTTETLYLNNLHNSDTHQTSQGHQFLPHPSNTDGFYYSKIKKLIKND